MIAALWLYLALQVTPELRQRVEAGLKAKQAGDLDAAIREFQRVVELAPMLPAAHVNLGAVYSEKKDYAGAIPPLRKALELNPDLPGAHGMLGVALLAQGYASESIAHLEKAKAVDMLGIALFEAGRTREAIDKLEEAAEKRPGDPDLLYYLSQAHAKLARQAAQVITDQSPDSPRAHQLRAESHAAGGGRDQAGKEFRAALAARPELRGVHLALGELYLGAGDYAGAEREFRAEATMAPGSATAAYKLGEALRNLGETKQAIAELQRADKLQPDSPEILLQLGTALASSDPAAAEALLRRVLQLEKESSVARSAHFQLAQILRKLGRTAEADAELKRFKELQGGR